jgi:hypothetical protein
MSSGSSNVKYDNDLVNIITKRKIPRIETPGILINETAEGEEINTYFWLALELVNSGHARFIDNAISRDEWTQIHFKERLNPAGPPGPLPDEFYSLIYQNFIQLELDEENRTNLNRIKARYREILESRINRITRLASSEAVSLTRVLQKEENDLYNDIHQIVQNWREEMRGIGGE